MDRNKWLKCCRWELKESETIVQKENSAKSLKQIKKKGAKWEKQIQKYILLPLFYYTC